VVLSPVDSPLLGFGNAADDEYLYPLNIHTNGYAKSLVVKTGPGRLYGFTAYSNRASAQFILLFDATGIPAANANPAVVFPVAAISMVPVQYFPARTFQTGCVLVNSTAADTYVAGSVDTYIDAQYT
jgi:hypothetical protein